MDTLPFAATFDALAFIVKKVRESARMPQVAEYIPCLAYACSSTGWEQATGRIVESIPYEFYGIGWTSPEDITEDVEVNIWGTRLFVQPEILKRLAGKQLVLRNVDSGGRSRPGADRQLLIAVKL